MHVECVCVCMFYVVRKNPRGWKASPVLKMSAGNVGLGMTVNREKKNLLQEFPVKIKTSDRRRKQLIKYMCCWDIWSFVAFRPSEISRLFPYAPLQLAYAARRLASRAQFKPDSIQFLHEFFSCESRLVLASHRT